MNLLNLCEVSHVRPVPCLLTSRSYNATSTIMQTPEAGPTTVPLSRLIFGITVFLGAFLLFQIEFVLAKFLLPWFGGTTGVWATSILCFQLTLLAGYAYAHWVRGWPTQTKIHLAVIALVATFVIVRAMTSGVLPGPGAKPLPDANPVTGILLIF